MRKKSRKSKNEEADSNLSENNANGSENADANDENQKSESDEPERETKRRKTDKRVSFSPKKAAKERDAKEKEPKEKESKSKEKEKEKEVDNGDVQYEVEAVLDEKTIRNVKHYLIRWKGYDSDGDTWEPENTVSCPDLIKQFHSGRKSTKLDTSKSKKKKHDKQNKGKKDGKGEEEEDDWDENEEFEIDRIIEVHHKRDGKREFLVSWKGYPPSQNSWVLEEHMTCNDLIAKFMSKVKKAREVDHKDLRVKRTHTDRFTLSTFDTGRRLSKRNKGKQRVQYHDAE